jgi:transcription elongation factor GreB
MRTYLRPWIFVIRHFSFLLLPLRRMSKAFTREDDVAEETILRPQLSSLLPPGAKNYITPDGARRLQDELTHLTEVERPRFAALPDDADAKSQLAIVNQRIAQIDESLRSAEVVQPPTENEDVVRFGATVVVRDREGEQTSYRIVGVDETDIDHGWVSWRSPIARALINARVGQRVKFRFPAGEDELEIVSVNYE